LNLLGQDLYAVITPSFYF
jgi:hypothetical protein